MSLERTTWSPEKKGPNHPVEAREPNDVCAATHLIQSSTDGTTNLHEVQPTIQNPWHGCQEVNGLAPPPAYCACIEGVAVAGEGSRLACSAIKGVTQTN